MFFSDYKDTGLWQGTRRKFLKILALTGTGSAVGLSGPFKNKVFGKEGGISPEEMRIRAMELFRKPKLFQ
jgi:hypothetical protein